MPSPTWLIATHNAGKLAEFQALLGEQIKVVGAASLGLSEAAETADTFVENALAKARHGALHSKLPTIADDSGLVVDALGGLPGVRSARYAGDDASDDDNVAKLLNAMTDVPTQDRGARFICVLVAVMSPTDPVPVIAQGVWPGRIATSPRGDNGFGYDPIFEDPEISLTAAQLAAATKNRRSHRGRALQRLQHLLQA
jgi:XTP/dITP diphosphohydrolase